MRIAAGSDHIGNLKSIQHYTWHFLRIRSHTPRGVRASSPMTHLELHDRLADHREQPRRQRDQLRREIRVRRTGGDRRRRLLVLREQHRLEQLEPLQQPIRSR